MKKEKITRMFYVIMVLLFSNQHLKAQVADPPETLPEAPAYNDTYVKPIFSDTYAGSATIKKFTTTSETGSEVTVLEDNMIKFTTALGAWSFAEFNETIDLSDYDFLSFDIYTVQANFFVKVRFNDASTPPTTGNNYMKAGGTAVTGEWTRITVNLADYYNAVTATKPTYNNITKLSFINHGGQARTVYIDNIIAYKSSSLPTLMNISKSNTDLILAGPWNDSNFANLDNANVTSLDIVNVSGLANKPNAQNPNCLIYTNDETITGTNVVLNGVASDISISEGSPYNNVKSIVANNITYTRNYPTIGWGSLCLPYNLETIPTGMKAYEFTSAAGASVNFDTVESLEANTPYIVEILTDGLKDFSLKEGTYNLPVTKIISKENGNFVFKGTFSEISGEDMYLLNKNGLGFAHGGSAATIPSFRAYIEDKTGSMNARQLTLGLDGNGATGIDYENNPNGLTVFTERGKLIINASEIQTIKIYALDGRIVKSLDLSVGDNVVTDLPRGFFVLNGQKIMMK